MGSARAQKRILPITTLHVSEIAPLMWRGRKWILFRRRAPASESSFTHPIEMANSRCLELKSREVRAASLGSGSSVRSGCDSQEVDGLGCKDMLLCVLSGPRYRVQRSPGAGWPGHKCFRCRDSNSEPGQNMSSILLFKDQSPCILCVPISIQ